MSSTPLHECCWRCRSLNISARSRPWSAPLAACKTTCGAGVIRVQGPPSDSSSAPPYLVNMCQPMSMSSTRRHLRSAAHGNLVELRCRTTRYGKQSFPASAPLIWNSLPTTVRDVSTSMNSFSGRLKAELFRRAYGTDLAPMWQLSVNSFYEHKFSYLLTYLLTVCSNAVSKNCTDWKCCVAMVNLG